MVLNNYNILLDKLKTSLWFIPAAISFMGIFLALGMFYLDIQINAYGYASWLSHFDIGISNIRQVIVVTTGSVITITGVVFSMTMVALTLASNQFGPKILRNFLADTSHKLTLGLLLSVFFYGIIVLSILDGKGDDYRPLFTALTNLLLTVIAISSLIVFIHRVSTSIQADQIISLIGEDIDQELRQLEPSIANEETKQESEQWEKQIQNCEEYPLLSDRHGYICSIEWDELVELTCDKNIYLDINTRQGKFLLDGAEFGKVYLNSKKDRITYKDVINHISVDQKRTPFQDLEYGIDQLVQVALRTLSPGINDSITAITCIDWLSAAISRMAKCSFPSTYKKDNHQNLRIKINPFSFKGAVETAYNPIRQNCSNNEVVFIYLLESLIGLIEVIEHPKRCEILSHQIEALLESYNPEKFTTLDQGKVNSVLQRYKTLMQAKAHFVT